MIKLLTNIIFCIVLTFLIFNEAKANYTSVEFQKSLFDIGFKEVNVAIQESKEHFKKDIALPIQIPPVTFTHSFGRLSNLEGDINDGLEIEYRHKDKPKNHYMIWVKPAKHGLSIIEDHIDQTFTLKDGSKAIYSTKKAKGFNLLIFEKDGWQYILNINKDVSDQNTPENLVEIANSVSP
ncbi:hypothetical protein EJF36_17440 [Bacillus sp. HMF5848]|uniref:hypothetical protein n=1 Tax=Bacillus sp. HMF5848 TaxID=2495421 RepID=UPI000F774933|nr:hypothetical protein [Bacillus sp. HMF5848]RSK28508.1 hypothetical protein EJF36_17440 [Bacillus sp. HMF5848]